MRLCEKIDKNMADSVKVSHLLRGLHPKIAKDIYFKEPKNPSEVYDQLVAFEKFESLMGNHFSISTFEMVPPAADELANAIATKLEQMHFATTSPKSTNR